MEEINIIEFYDKKYSSFKAIPYFNKERLKKLALFNLVSNSLDINFKDKTCLDLGCGLGITTYILSELFTQTTGLDFSKHAITIAELFNDKSDVSFKLADVTDSGNFNKYDVVTAFGLSIFNTPDLTRFVEECKTVSDNYLNKGGILLINSHTDFSGSYPTGWYCHSRKEITNLINLLRSNYKKVNVFFPHRKLKHFFGYGVEQFLIESLRFFTTRKRQFFIIIQN